MFIKDGLYIIITIILLLLIIVLLPIYIIIILGVLCLLYLLSIFYIPKINASPFPKTFLAPANGKITSINEKILGDKTYNEVTITLNFFKSHINVIPMSGKVENISATCDVNKSNKIESTTEIVTEFGTYCIKQISSGFINKLVNNLNKNVPVEIDQFFGYVIFHGQLILYIPDNFEVVAMTNDKVSAGIDVIARLK
jgi:hypothetical protein